MFEKTSVTVYSPDDAVLLKEWREPTGAKLWRFSLRPQDNPSITTNFKSSPVALNAHDLPSIRSFVRYVHLAVVFPVKSNWLTAIKAGKLTSWPGLTYANASNFCPVSVESLQGYLTQARKIFRSTKPKSASNTTLPEVKSQELFVHVESISKLYMDGMGCFPVFSHSGNHYVTMAFHVDTNATLVEPFQSKTTDISSLPTTTS